MYYKTINIPIVLEIGEDIFVHLDDILKKNHIYFKEKILITSLELKDLYKTSVDKLSFDDIIFIKGGSYEEAQEVMKSITNRDALFVAFGGGSIIDAVKLMANTLDLTYITVPSTLSNDAIYSPIARLVKDGKKQSFGVKAPLGIIADVNIIKGSPQKLILAGVGDLVSNASAVKDWMLAHADRGESINNFALALASLSGNSVIPYTIDDIRTPRFIGDLANGLVISGLAMVLANSSRPASGAEHLISHAIDDLFPERATLHGLQVAWGHLLVEREFRQPESDYEKLLVFFERMKMLDEIERDITFSKEEVEQIILRAKTIRDRYTILSKV